MTDEETLQRLARYVVALRRQLDNALTSAGPRSQLAPHLTAGIALADACSRDVGHLLALATA